MFTVKTLAGEIISLDVTQDNFCQAYLSTLDPDIQPFCEVKLLSQGDEWYVLVDVHDLLFDVIQEIDASSHLVTALGQNPHPKALEFLCKKQNRRNYNLMYDHPHSLSLLQELSHNKDFIDRFHDRIIAYRHPRAFYSLVNNLKGEAGENLFHSYYDMLWKYLLENPNMQPEWLEFILREEILVSSPYIEEYRLLPNDEDWERYNRMPQMLPYFQANPEHIVKKELNKNPAAVGMLRENPGLIRVSSLCANHSTDAMQLLLEVDPQLQNVEWSYLCNNPYAADFLREELMKKKRRIRFIDIIENPAMISDIEQHLSHPKLSITYYAILMKKLIGNPAAGRIVLRGYSEGCYSYMEYLKMCKMPYIFREGN